MAKNFEQPPLKVELISSPKEKSNLERVVQFIGTIILIAGFIFGIYQFNTQQTNDQSRTVDQQQQTTLETYLDRMSDLLFSAKPSLSKSKPGDEVRSVARARTLVALQNLNPTRKGILIKFLHESLLISTTRQTGDNNPIIDLSDADLNNADLSNAKLSYVDLNGADLSGADLSGTDLSNANLRNVNLSNAKLNHADLSSADLSSANLSSANLKHTYLRNTILTGATITQNQINQAYTCKKTITPEGTTPSQVPCP